MTTGRHVMGSSAHHRRMGRTAAPARTVAAPTPADDARRAARPPGGPAAPGPPDATRARAARTRVRAARTC
ncbi:hypothetical protein ACFVTP_24355 [Streptomyces celluloflavus]|uniref:hypothetical protein n=1 Tax=Streptomyces celluloflavus TaxID=58344 RepID=UPI0036DEDD04